jgi:protein transport protein SEC61 subunit gamma-like protein
MINIADKLKNYARVLRIAKKPTLEDFKDTARVCLIGMAAIGVIGFLLYMLFVALPI